MDLYPLNLVLATALGSATIFLGTLPTRLMRFDFFHRELVRAALAWMIVAAASPWEILHYPVLVGLLCLIAWRQFRRDFPLSGKMGLNVASALGTSLGVVLILAVTPRAWPSGSSTLHQVLLLASLYLSGAVIGAAYILRLFTRLEATEAGMPVSTVHHLAGLLWGLILGRAAVLITLLGLSWERPISWIAGLVLAIFLIALPCLGWLARHRCRSPRPSQSGPLLLGICLLGFGAENLARLFDLHFLGF